MASIFTKIINGDLPAHKIYETDNFLAFLDIEPNAKGHTLCVPKKEVDKIFDLEKETYNELMDFSRTVGVNLEKAVDCNRVGIAVVGLEVPHVHVHLIPLNSMNDIDFRNALDVSQDDLAATAEKIRQYF